MHRRLPTPPVIRKHNPRMWQTQYDENLEENPLFREIQSCHTDILARVSSESWIVAVPRHGTLEPDDITLETIMDHILIPSSESASLFYTLTKKQLNIRNKQLVPMDEGPYQPVRILFEETFYNKNHNKTSVFCLEAPLFRVCSLGCAPHQPLSLETSHDCIDFLWREHQGPCLGLIQDLCAANAPKLDNLAAGLAVLYEKCLGLVLARWIGRERAKIELAVECYMQSCLQLHLIKAINTLKCHEDAELNKIVRNSNQELQLKDFNISSVSNDCILAAKAELSKINDFVTALDKVNCLKTSLNYLYNAKEPLTAEHMLQISVFLIVKTSINNWAANLAYLTEFRVSRPEPSDETGFIVANLEAAIEFIRNEDFKQVIRPKNEPNPSGIFKTMYESNFAEFKRLLTKINEPNSVETKHHPLCTCETCLIQPIEDGCDLSSRNEKGQSLIIVATLLNRFVFVEFLLKSDRNEHLPDYSGRIAHHYAAGHGYQDVLLLLIDSGADVNLGDYEGNTALHLAAQNGQENCVKTLLYTSKALDINAVNKRGESALHLATRWSYIEIMKILLENDASVGLKNTKRETVFDLASNYATEVVLQEFCRKRNEVFRVRNSHCEKKVADAGRPFACEWSHGHRPKSLSQIKKIELLLKAIENNDLPLTCFYLGFPTVRTATYAFEAKCHPLCNCEKCEDMPSHAPAAAEPISVNACNFDGYTALHAAAKYGRTDILGKLLDSQAIPSLKTYKHRQTALHLACIHQRMGAVRALVACTSCEIDAQDWKGNTPLYYAVVGNNVKIVEVLLGNGANAEVRNFQGMSARQEAQERCLFGVAKLLSCHETSASDDEFDFL